MVKHVDSHSLFDSATKETLELIKDLNNKKRHTFLIPTKFISSECGQVAFLLDRLYNYQKTKNHRRKYRTCFANSRFEALQGAFKLARHKRASQSRKKVGPIVVYDPDKQLQFFVDPLGRGDQEALIPGIRIVSRWTGLAKALDKKIKPLALAMRNPPKEIADKATDLIQKGRQAGILTILEQSDLDLSDPEQLIFQLPILPDIIVTGESLTNYEIPFGAFSMTLDVHQPWAQLDTCFLHSSTCAGNTLALTRARDCLLTCAPCLSYNEDVRMQCIAIRQSHQKRRQAFARYVNPGLVNLYALTGLDVLPTQAHGSKLSIDRGQDQPEEIIDCISGGGTAARGHTSLDIVPEVIARHETKVDYWEQLTTQLKTLGWPQAFPAVSGATAVDIALILSMLANKDKTKIVIFCDNYAGKTLLSLIGSHNPTARTPFFPLYHDVSYIDPSASDALASLEKVLCSGEVALVWLELMQGGTTRVIGDDLVQLIIKHKETYGYKIGVDEILMGFFRIDRLFSYKGRIEKPDIITLSKPLTDATFPFAVTLVDSCLYEEAIACDTEVVRYLETCYKNQLGSHIALHALQKLLTPDFEANVKKVSQTLSTGFRELANNSDIPAEVRGEGHIYQLVYSLNRSLFRHLGEKANQMFVLYMCDRMVRHGKAFLFFDRCLPALTLSNEEAQELLTNLALVFDRKQTKSTYRKFSFFVLKTVLFLAKEGANKLKMQLGRKI